MLFLDGVCDTSAVLEIIMFADKLLGVVFFIVPMLLIVMVIVDLTKGVASNEDEMRKRLNVTVRRIVLAVILFLMPNVITLFNSVVNNTGYSECLKNANAEYIRDVKLKEAAVRATIDNKARANSKKTVVNFKKKKQKIVASTTMYGVTLNGKLPEGDKYYPLDGKNNKGKLLPYLEIDGKFLNDDEQEEMKKFIKSAVKSSDNWNDRVALAAWSLVYGLSKNGLRLHYFKGNQTWGVGDTVDPVGTCSKGWCKNWGRFASAQAVNIAISGYGYVNAQGDAGKSKYYTGMGCDGFGRWAIKTSGCGHDLIADKYLKQDRETFSRTSDYSSGKAGDMLMTGQGNGHTRIFLKYDKKKKAVLTVEATSGGAGIGLFFHYYSVNELKPGGYEVVSMGKGYDKYCKKSNLKK